MVLVMVMVMVMLPVLVLVIAMLLVPVLVLVMLLVPVMMVRMEVKTQSEDCALPACCDILPMVAQVLMRLPATVSPLAGKRDLQDTPFLPLSCGTL